MRKLIGMARNLCALAAAVALTLSICSQAAAHCDTLDGPVIEDARKALSAGEVTPVLKWVREKDEKGVKAAFAKALAARGKKQQEPAEKKFFESLVRIHRAGEGAPFTGLKPAGTVEPVIVAADKALTGDSADDLVKMVTDAVSGGIRQRYEKVVAALKHKDDSVQQGREYVAAYVEYTHYVERLQLAAEKPVSHHGEHAHKTHAAPRHQHGHGN